MAKSTDAFRTIGEVSDDLDVPKHVLRFWEGKFPQLKPMKRGGGRRFYRPEDVVLLRGIHQLLHAAGYTIKGVQRIMREDGVDAVKTAAGRASTSNAPTIDTATETALPRKRKAARRTSSALPDAALPPGLRDHLNELVQELEVCLAIARGQGLNQPAPEPAARAAAVKGKR